MEDLRGVVTVLASIIGSAGFLALMNWLTRRSERSFEDRIAVRTEWRDEVGKLRGQVDHLSREVDTWQKNYYELKVDQAALLVEHKQCIERTSGLEAQITLSRTENQELRAQVAELRLQIMDLKEAQRNESNPSG